MRVTCYRLCTRSGDSVVDRGTGHSRMLEALQSPGLDLVQKVGVEAFCGEARLIVELNKVQLLMGMPANLNIHPAKLICLLPADIGAGEEVLDKCTALRYGGYQLAFQGFPPEGLGHPLLKRISYMVLDTSKPGYRDAYDTMKSRFFKVQLVLDAVPDNAAYTKMREKYTTAWFSGRFYKQPLTSGASDVSPLKINMLQLMTLVNEPDFELEDVSRVIERDPALSISLLRHINGGAAGKGRRVSSIQNAVAILGQNDMRTWAAVAVSVKIVEDRPGEVTRLSLIRARFAENLATAFELGVFQRKLFITGLFSLLDVILQKPMQQAISEVAVDAEVRKCLVDKTGMLRPVLELIFSYEHADWNDVTRRMIQNGVEVERLNEAFVEAMTWYNQLLTAIDTEAKTKS